MREGMRQDIFLIRLFNPLHESLMIFTSNSDKIHKSSISLTRGTRLVGPREPLAATRALTHSTPCHHPPSVTQTQTTPAAGGDGPRAGAEVRASRTVIFAYLCSVSSPSFSVDRGHGDYWEATYWKIMDSLFSILPLDS